MESRSRVRWNTDGTLHDPALEIHRTEGVPERAAEAGEAFGAEAVMDDDPPPEGTLMSGTGYEPPESVVPVTLVPPFANVYPSA